jgi:hypothetical protein
MLRLLFNNWINAVVITSMILSLLLLSSFLSSPQSASSYPTLHLDPPVLLAPWMQLEVSGGGGGGDKQTPLLMLLAHVWGQTTTTGDEECGALMPVSLFWAWDRRALRAFNVTTRIVAVREGAQQHFYVRVGDDYGAQARSVSSLNLYIGLRCNGTGELGRVFLRADASTPVRLDESGCSALQPVSLPVDIRIVWDLFWVVITRGGGGNAVDSVVSQRADNTLEDWVSGGKALLNENDSGDGSEDDPVARYAHIAWSGGSSDGFFRAWLDYRLGVVELTPSKNNTVDAIDNATLALLLLSPKNQSMLWIDARVGPATWVSFFS